jgi:hypothetical protein
VKKKEKPSKYQVGDFVGFRTGGTKHGFYFIGATGCVVMLDAKAGVCVNILVSDFFRPCFWFKESELKPANKKPAVMTTEQIESAVSQFEVNRGVYSPVSAGLLRSWVVAKAKTKPGQALFDACFQLPLKQLEEWFENDDDELDKWLEANDDRVRRPRILDEMDDDLEAVGPVKRSRPGR